MPHPNPQRQAQIRKVNRFIAMALLGGLAVIMLPAVIMIHAILSGGDPLKIGQTTPAFTLANQHGKAVSSDDLRGAWWLIYFYTNDARAESTAEARDFAKANARLKALEVRLLGASFDDVPSHRGFAAATGIDHDLLADPEGNMIYDYGAQPSTARMVRRISYLVDASGKVRRVYSEGEPGYEPARIIADVSAYLLATNPPAR